MGEVGLKIFCNLFKIYEGGWYGICNFKIVGLFYGELRGKF